MVSRINTKSLKRLKKSLPKSGMQEIANHLGISLATVSRTFNGENKSRLKEVVDYALIIIDRERSEIEGLNNRIEAL